MALLDLTSMDFLNDSFCKEHNTNNAFCETYVPHIFGMTLSCRPEQYVYTCPRGLSFMSLPITANHMLVVGPFIFPDSGEAAKQLYSKTDGIAAVTREQVADLAQWLLFALRGNGYCKKHSDLSELTEGIFVPAYSVDTLRDLFAKIRSGDQDGARPLLEDMIDSTYRTLSFDFDALRYQVKELFIRMSRAAVKGGAERKEVMQFSIERLREADLIQDPDAYREWLSNALNTFVSFVFDLNDVKHRSIIFKTNEYIRTHMSEKITLDAVAGNVFLSKAYFSKIISDELGMPFTDYLASIRIDRSKILLRESDLSIVQIAKEVGFSDQAYFSRVFKSLVGTTPGKYRSGST